MGKAKKFGIAVLVFFMFIIGVGLVASIDDDDFIYEDSYNPGTFGEVRNCIKSALGNNPDCSDRSERILPTTCNGRNIGEISYSQASRMC